jgi:hypothetical protein
MDDLAQLRDMMRRCGLQDAMAQIEHEPAFTKSGKNPFRLSPHGIATLHQEKRIEISLKNFVRL